MRKHEGPSPRPQSDLWLDSWSVPSRSRHPFVSLWLAVMSTPEVVVRVPKILSEKPDFPVKLEPAPEEAIRIRTSPASGSSRTNDVVARSETPSLPLFLNKEKGTVFVLFVSVFVCTK